MTGLVRKATLLSVCGLFVAGAAFASVPAFDKSQTDLVVKLVGSNGATVDPVGNFTVIVRDLANNVVQNSSVVVDFSACGTFDTRLANAQTHTGMTLDCPTKTVRGVTDATGTVVFRILGGAQNSGAVPPPGNTTRCARVFADGVLIKSTVPGFVNPSGNVSVAAYNENGSTGAGNGMNVADLSSLIGDIFASSIYLRSDFDGNAVVNVVDLSNFVGVLLANGSLNGAAGYCP